MVAVFADTCPQEVRGFNEIDLHEVGRLKEHGVLSQMGVDIFDMVAHPSLDRPTDEVQVLAQTAGRATVLSGSNPLQEYMDRDCSIVWPHVPITGR